MVGFFFVIVHLAPFPSCVCCCSPGYLLSPTRALVLQDADGVSARGHEARMGADSNRSVECTGTSTTSHFEQVVVQKLAEATYKPISDML